MFFLPAVLAAALITPSWAGDAELYGAAIDRVRRHYLYIDDLDLGDAVELAAESAEGAVPWLLVSRTGDRLILAHGERGVIGEVPLAGLNISTVAAALESIEDSVRGAADARTPMPEGRDLAVDLLRGVSRALDKHSAILSGRGLARFDERISGRIEGVGAQLSIQAGQHVVREVFVGGPADLGGLKAGDRLVRVDGVLLRGMSAASAANRLRGEDGTQVVLSIERELPTGLDAFELVLTRAEVAVPNVTWQRTPSGMGLIKITHFSEQTTVLLRRALEELGGDPTVRGFLLDLRRNSGGSMIQSCTAADLFLGDGPVLRTEGREGRPVERLIPEYRARSDGGDADQLPVVVLQGPHSASAAEILAGALMLRSRAVLLGGRSHGKGTVQKVYALRKAEDGGKVSMKVTVARYLLPGDVPIEAGVGLVPDLELRQVRFDREGVRLPVGESEALVDVSWVDERVGWRDAGLAEARGDELVELGTRVILAAEGAHRLDLLRAVETVAAAAAADEEQRLVQTMRYHGLDWTSADEDGPPPEVRVSLELVDPPTAGSIVELRAEVENLGASPLYRGFVSLRADDPRLPWHGLTLPVGFVPPGESALGRAYVAIGERELDREDEVQMAVHADRRPPQDVPPAALEISARGAPLVALQTRLSQGEGSSTLALTVENQGARSITDVEVKVRLLKADVLELSSDDVVGGAVAPGESVELSLDAVWVDGVIPQDVLARVTVHAEPWGRLGSFPATLSPDGRVSRLRPPELEGQVPLRLPEGPAAVKILARDDWEVASVSAWYAGDQLLWKAPHAAAVELPVEFVVRAGGAALVVEATDEQGVETRREWWVRGLSGDDALVETGVDLPPQIQLLEGDQDVTPVPPQR